MTEAVVVVDVFAAAVVDVVAAVVIVVAGVVHVVAAVVTSRELDVVLAAVISRWPLMLLLCFSFLTWLDCRLFAPSQ